MVVRFLRNIQTMLFIISCQSIQRISLKVIPVFAAKVFKVFPSKLFWYLQVLRNYLLSKNISVSKSIIWLSHQVVIYFPDFAFFLNFLHKSAFTFHFTLSFNIFVQHHWPNLARSILQYVGGKKRVNPTLFMDSLINFASKISDVTALPQTQRLISLICLWTKCNYKFFRHLPRSPKKWDVSADTKGNPSCHS